MKHLFDFIFRTTLIPVLLVSSFACQGTVSETPDLVEAGASEADNSDATDTQSGSEDEATVTEVEAPSSDFVYIESFMGPNGAPWPAPWEPAENSPVFIAEIQGNRARLQGNSGMVLRMVQQNLSIINCDVYFTVEFENFSNQGVGFYCRQNGGYLNASTTPGQGYGVFLEGNGGNLGLWYELNGDEDRHQATSIFSIFGRALDDDTEYSVRYQVVQITPAMTLQQAKVWLAGEVEPEVWQVISDDQPDFGETPLNPMEIPVLQGSLGGIALDLYNYAGSANIFISDLSVSEL